MLVLNKFYKKINMSEKSIIPNMPSGYEDSVSLEQTVLVDGNILPWLNRPYDLKVAECTLQSGEKFLLSSAVGTSPKLVEAAHAMTDSQLKITDNMFYSRIPTVISQGYSPSVETMPSTSTDFPIGVMRNKGGQRVYFARVNLGIPQEQAYGPTIVRLGVCDKNKQENVMSVLSGSSYRQMRRKMSK
jgi:hypothetical protein